MTKNETLCQIFNKIGDVNCIHKTDTQGTGFYDLGHRADGYFVNRFLGSDPESVAHDLGIWELQFSDHGAGKRSIQAFGPKRELLADYTYIGPQ